MATHTSLSDLFTDIADEIRTKKGTSETIVADDFPDEIASIPSGGDPSEYFNTTPTAEELATPDLWVRDKFVKNAPNLIIPNTITNLSGLCRGLFTVPKIICSDSITDMSNMYSYSSSEEIDVSELNTSNVTTVQNMFGNSKLKNIDVSNFDLRKISSSTRIGTFFNRCNVLEYVKAPILMNDSYGMRNWFGDNYSLKTLIIPSNFVVTYNVTFSNCYHMDGTVNATYNPQGLKDGRIYVPDTLVDSYKTATGWSTYADQILPISQYVEE